MKSKATGCRSISTAFSSIVLLCVSSIIIIILIIIIKIIVIIITTTIIIIIIIKDKGKLRGKKIKNIIIESKTKLAQDERFKCY